MTHSARQFLAVVSLFCVAISAQAQDPEVQLADSTVVKRIEALAAIMESSAVVRADIADRERAYRRAPTAEARESIDEELRELNQRLSNLEADFATVAAGIDTESFFDRRPTDFSWQEELREIFSPIIAELREVTARPREMERLKADLQFREDRIAQIGGALEMLGQIQSEAVDQELGAELQRLGDFWAQQQNEFLSEYNALQVQLEERQRSKRSIGEISQDIFSVFFKSRGRNLVIALAAFFGLFFLLRFSHRLVQSSPLHKSGRHQFVVRVIDFVYFLFTIFTALVGALIVLYLASDWLLLGLVILFLLGLGWTAIKALPEFLEQAKLLLNLGPVREAERIIYNEIPWRVSSLSTYADLHNPLLKSGTIRLPLRDLIGLRSRPFDESEIWFPSIEGDWVVLKDGFYGKVVNQTPDVVQIATRRGSYKSYPTADFLHQHPMNLSTNTFVVNRTLSISHDHRSILNSEISTKLKEYMKEEIEKFWYGEYLIETRAELKEIAASSLDMVLILKFTGEAASEYFEIGWHLQQIALDACNKYGWRIPYPQLMLHKNDSLVAHEG